ncbi:MAG: hypothetical protein O9301_15415 [Leptospira sp.]|nr:hypothetical protein [Leptospira sp.]
MNWNYRIKKPEKGTPLNWEIYVPQGLSSFAGEIIISKLNDIPLPNQIVPKVRIFPEKIKIEKANSHQIVYLMMNLWFIRDIRLVIAKTSDWDSASEKRESEWDRLKTLGVNFVKPLFKNQNSLFYSIKENIHISFFEDEITLSFSMYGEPGYKRGIKSILPTSAPVPEDLASALILYSYLHFEKNIYDTKLLFVPFAGTLTFATEWWLLLGSKDYFLLPRETQFPNLNFFPDGSVTHFRKRNILELAEKSNSDYENIDCKILDSDPALKSYWETEVKNWSSILTTISNWDFRIGDFFKTDSLSDVSGDSLVFIPINPPYGFRKTERFEPKLYAKIGQKLESLLQNKIHNLLGFVLCPREEDWSDLMNSMKSFRKKTIHVTHGGIDLRCLIFSSGGRSDS